MKQNIFPTTNLSTWDTLSSEQKDQLMNEGFDYLLESINEWKARGTGRTMVALAKFAHRWNSIGGPKAKMKILQTEINDLKRGIERRKKIGEPYEMYSKELVTIQETLTKMKEMYPEKGKAA